MVDRELINNAIPWEEEQGSDERTLCEEKAQVDERVVKALTILLALATIAIFVSAPVLTFIFARAAWGGIVLRAEAAAKTVFGVLLAVLAMAVGVVLACAVAGAVVANKGRVLVTDKNAAIIGAAAFTSGAILTGWVLAWVLPVVTHG